jgi:predicted acetyltransferase
MRQETFQFGEFFETKKPQLPKGYQGLSGFHKYWGKKPIEAYEFLITHLTNSNDVVLASVGRILCPVFRYEKWCLR